MISVLKYTRFELVTKTLESVSKGRNITQTILFAKLRSICLEFCLPCSQGSQELRITIGCRFLTIVPVLWRWPEPLPLFSRGCLHYYFRRHCNLNLNQERNELINFLIDVLICQLIYGYICSVFLCIFVLFFMFIGLGNFTASVLCPLHTCSMLTYLNPFHIASKILDRIFQLRSLIISTSAKSTFYGLRYSLCLSN